MLKFISTDSDNQNLLNSILNHHKNLDEYLKETSYEKIFESLKNYSEKSTKKDKNPTNFVNKIVSIILYEYSNHTNFTFGENSKLISEKLISISLLNNKNNFQEHLENLIKFYNILANYNSGRYFLIQKIFEFYNSPSTEEYSDFFFNFEAIENLLVDFLKSEKNFQTKEILNFFDLLCNFVRKNKLFKNLEK